MTFTTRIQAELKAQSLTRANIAVGWFEAEWVAAGQYVIVFTARATGARSTWG